MRTSTTRFAKQAERFLTAGAPTGLTGVYTHPGPRPALIAIYNQTLKNLSLFPKDSAYRASVEAITKHRLKIVESAVPEGYEAWVSRVEKTHPELVQKVRSEGRTLSIEPVGRWDLSSGQIPWDGTGTQNDGRGEGPAQDPSTLSAATKKRDANMMRAIAENDALVAKAEEENKHITNEAERKAAVAKSLDRLALAQEDGPAPESEPPLTADQISELEQKFSSGLIEEVVDVAQGELELTVTMYENKVWEELVEKAPEGQWSYFERARHVKGTQAPPQ